LVNATGATRMVAPAAAPIAAQAHSVALMSAPSGANVWSQGRFVGVTPLPIDVPRGQSLRVRLSLAGYTSQTLDLSPNEDQRIVKLERAPTNGAAVSTAERARPQRRTRPNANTPSAASRRPAGSAGPSGKSTDKPSEAYEKF
jgi:hypothetical protein